MQYNVKAPYLVETHWQIEEVLDGDSIIIKNKFKNKRKVIRLYGLDAPEIKLNSKIKSDEKKSHIPAELLIKLGFDALHYVLQVAPPKTSITIITELDNYYDRWNRQLAYVILPNNKCLNDLLLENGYAKVIQQYKCSRMAEFKAINEKAKIRKLGMYRVIRDF